MAEWKKVIVSGSAAELSSLTLDTGLANDQLANSAITIAGSATSLGGSITADTIAGQISSTTITNAQLVNDGITIGDQDTSLGGSVLNNLTHSATGSFTGSFVGDGSNLTGVSATSFDFDGLPTITSLGGGDFFAASQGGTESKITFANISSSIYSGVSGDATIAAGGALTIANNAVDNDKLADIARGSVKVGGALNAPTDLDAKTSGQILVGDGTDINSVAVSGDISLASNGAVTLGTVGANHITEISNLTEDEGAQLENINSVTISNTQWGYLGAMDQDVTTTSDVNFNDVTVAGDLTVQGDVTELQTTNLNVEDQFILLHSGSSGTVDSGVIFGGTSGTAQQGKALIWDASYNSNDGRLAISTTDVASNSTSNFGAGTTGYYVAGVYDGSAANAATAKADHRGNIRVDSSDDIFIYV